MWEKIDYQVYIDRAMRSMVGRLLAKVAEEGLPGEHHFVLSFRTDADQVELSPSLRAQYPEEITIVLQHQFWELEVDDEMFAVTLKFGGHPERLCVPFSALTAFVDPAAQFGMRFESEAEIQADRDRPDSRAPSPSEGAVAQSSKASAKRTSDRSSSPGSEASVVNMEDFRRRS